MVSPQNQSSIVSQENSLQQHSSNGSERASRVPIKNTEDWEQPDFDEIDICMEVTAYIYHWQ